MLAVVERTLEAEADEVDEEAEQRDVDRAAQPLAEGEQPEHLARVRVRVRVRVSVRVSVRVRVGSEQPEHQHVARDEGVGHEVAAEELDRRAGRRVQHLGLG